MTIYIVIALVAAGIGLLVYVCCFHREKEETKCSNANESKEETKQEPEVESGGSTDTKGMSAEEEYADSHGMWICEYCETLNAYPDGEAAGRKKEEAPRSVPVERKTGLRGDLLNRANKSLDRSVTKRDEMICIACGKHP